MSESFEEIMAAQKPAREAARQDRIRQLQERRAVGQTISELIADPRWEVFGRHIEAMRDRDRDRLKLVEIKLTSEVLTGDAYINVKVSQASARAAMRAYDNILQLAKTLIEQGEKALEELRLTNSED